MIECELIPEARGLVDFFVRSWIDIPLAECYAVHMEEEIFGFISQDFRQSLHENTASRPKHRYFRVHEEADLDEEEHGGTTRQSWKRHCKKVMAMSAPVGRWNTAGGSPSR